MIRTKLRIWPNGKLVEQVTTEYDGQGNVVTMSGKIRTPKIEDCYYAYVSRPYV